MRILLTGCCGFIGSHLGNKLVELGHEVLGVDNLSNYSDNKKNFKYEAIDFRQYVQEQDLDFDVIFHLAAAINVDESIKIPEYYFTNNSFGTLQLLEAARKRNFKGKIIYASSAEVYGTAQRAVMDEDHPLDPLSPYAVSKLAAEQLCKNYAQLYGLNIQVIRNFNTFGEHQRGGFYGGVIAKFKAQALKGEALTVYGSGEQMRDYMHISQAVDGYVLAMETKMPLIVNFGSGKPIKIVDIANYISTKFKVSLHYTNPRPNEIMRLQADVTRAMKCGYKVETDFWVHLENYLNAI
jgi:dTDP-glucose 4,6-dehydratase